MKKKKNLVKHCSCALFIDEAMEGSCSFESLVGTPCSFDRRDLILARVGICSVTSRDLSSFNICPFHRSELGIGWRRNSYFNSCQVPKEIANHIERREKPVKADRGVGKNISEYIHQQTGILIPVGSGTVGLIIALDAYKFLRLSVKKLYKVYDSCQLSWIT